MKKGVLALAAALVVSLLLTSAGSSAVRAAQTTNNGNVGQALEIAPPVLPLSADPGQTVKAELNLRNVSSSKLLVTGQVNDFIAAGEDGTPKILLDDSQENPRSMKSWVRPLPTLTTIPREIKKMPVTIVVPKNASPGGYYGVIRFTATPPELEGTGVSLSASLGTLVLLTVNGKVDEKLSVAEFSVNKAGKTGTLFESAPLEFVVRLKNDGNIHEQPAGQAEITDMFGKKVAVLSINQPPRNVLPSSIRKFSQPLDSSVIGNKKLFGRYTANLRVTYGADKQTTTSSLTFWVIPYRLIGAGIIVLVSGFFLLRFAIKRYNQSIIDKAQKGSGSKKKK